MAESEEQTYTKQFNTTTQKLFVYEYVFMPYQRKGVFLN